MGLYGPENVRYSMKFDFKRVGGNVGRVAVDLRMISGLILGALGMFGVDVNENTALATKLSTVSAQVETYKDEAEKYKKLYEEIKGDSEKTIDDIKGIFK